MGNCEHVRHAMTFKIFTDGTFMVSSCSNVHCAEDSTSPCAYMFVFLRHDNADGEQSSFMPFFETGVVGQHFTVRTEELRKDNVDCVSSNPTPENDDYDEIVTYNDLISYIELDAETSALWKLNKSTAQEGPRMSSHPSAKGSKYKVLIEWENREVTTEKSDDIFSICSICTRQQPS